MGLQRLLSYTEDEPIWPADRLCGKFFVRNSARMPDDEINTWVQEPDHFHMHQHVFRCQDCYRNHKAFKRSLLTVLEGRPLRALDLFAGSGGKHPLCWLCISFSRSELNTASL